MDELRAAVRELADAPSAGAADAFTTELAQAPPSPELATFISEALELSAVHEISDSKGVSVRWRLIDRLLGLGFPHALTVSPDDLDYHRERAQRGASIPAAFTAVFAGVSALWSTGWLLGFLIAAGTNAPRHLHYWVGLTGMLVAGGHSIAAFAAAVRGAQGGQRRRFITLAKMFFIGPLVALLCQLLMSDGAAIALFGAAPSMVTALLCGLSAAFAYDDSPPPPVRVSEPAAAPVASSRRERVRVR